MINNWYNKIAGFYDIFTCRFYQKPRKVLIEQLQIQKGDRIFVPACGTGQSFGLLQEKLGDTGEIIAIDFSKAMLAKAQKRIDKNHWNNITLIHADLTKISADFFLQNNINPEFDIVLAELAYSVIPNWQAVINNNINLLKPQGKIGVLDWYRPQNDLLTKTVDFLANAQSNRDVIGYIQGNIGNFTVKKSYFLGNVYTGIGSKQ